MIRILIADDHEIVRIGLRRILELDESIKVVGESSTGKETIRLCQDLKPNVVLLDLNMPDMDGLTAIPHIVSLGLYIRIIVLTIYDDTQYIRQAMQAGAKGFLLKCGTTGDIVSTIKKVSHGEIVVDQRLYEQTALEQYGKIKKTSTVSCSPRETQIITQLVRGIKMVDIASNLSISPSTVAEHKRRIMDRFGLKTNADLIRFADKHGLNLFETKIDLPEKDNNP